MKLLSAEELLFSFVKTALNEFMLDYDQTIMPYAKRERMDVVYKSGTGLCHSKGLTLDKIIEPDYVKVPDNFPVTRLLGNSYFFLDSILVTILGTTVAVDVDYRKLCEQLAKPEHHKTILESMRLLFSLTDCTAHLNDDIGNYKLNQLSTLREYYTHDGVDRIRLVTAYYVS